MCGDIDWAATGAMLSGWGTLLGSIAVIVAALLGGRTLTEWRAQRLDERKAAHAERILTATYKARRALAGVRSPIMFGSEHDKARETLVEGDHWKEFATEYEQKKAVEAQAYYNRLKRTQDVQNDLEDCLPLARALFGEQVELALAALKHHFWTVEVYVGANQRDKDSSDDRPFRQKIEQTIWSGYPSKDENYLDLEIDANIKTIEIACVPAIRMGSSDHLTAFLFPRRLS